MCSSDLVKDFSTFPLLYARHKPERPQRLFLPSNTLHVSNMPDMTSEDELLAVLVAEGAEVEFLRFIDLEHHIAIVVCSSVENAVNTLVNCHAQLVGLNNPRPMRIGFGQGSEFADPDMVYYDGEEVAASHELLT
jgi:hypothetical protein